MTAELPASPDQAAVSSANNSPGQAPDRRSNGRWQKGYCPNRNGRPRKPKPANILAGLLDETLPASGLTMREAVLKALVAHAVKDPRVALELMRLGVLMPPDATSQETDLVPEEDAQLDGFLAREVRRRMTNDGTRSEGA